LVARRFLGESHIFAPPALRSEKFYDLVSPHLFEDTRYASPFISWTENPARALEIISISDEPLHLAVIDYLDLEQDLEQRFGDRAGPWLVPVICQVHDLNDLVRIHRQKTVTAREEGRKHYTGTGEVSQFTGHNQ
jgi:hypothetical protein